MEWKSGKKRRNEQKKWLEEINSLPLLKISSSVVCPCLANRTPNLKLTEP
jgi:hypothetical protein